MFEHDSKGKSGEDSNFGSTIVSPTFQTNNVVSLKDDLFKQNKGYVEVSVNLKDVNKKNQDYSETKKYDFHKKIAEAHLKEERNAED